MWYAVEEGNSAVEFLMRSITTSMEETGLWPDPLENAVRNDDISVVRFVLRGSLPTVICHFSLAEV